MPTALGSRQNFQMWKWRALHKRRLFFLCLLQLICVFEWLVIFQSFHGAQYMAKSIRNQQEEYERDFTSIPGVMFVIHAVFLLAVLMSKFVRDKVDESQGRKICEVSLISLLVAGALFVFSPYDMHRHDTTSSLTGASFAMLTVFGLTACQQLGLNETDTLLARLSVVGLWTAFFATRPLDAFMIVAILLNVFSVFCGSSLQEHEFLRTFTKQKDINSITYGSGNLVADILFALRSMEVAVDQHYALLESEGLVRSAARDSRDVGAGGGANNLLTAEAAGADPLLSADSSLWEWNYQAASLRESSMLCRAVFYATASKEDHRPEAPTEFLFNRACHEIFGLFEGVCGSALTLFVNEAGGPVYVTARRTAFDLMLFLLIHDFVHAKHRGLCFVSCDCVGDATWRIRLQVTTTEAERHRTTFFEHDRPSDGKAGGHSSVLGPGQRGGRTLSTLLSESGAVAGRGLLLDENAWDQISSMDRLAERISHGYFSALIDVDDPQYLCGLKISRKFLKMPRDMCAASPSAFKGGFGGGPTDTGQPSSAPSSFPAAAPGACFVGSSVRHEWVFLVQRQPQTGGGGQGASGAGPDADYFSDIRDKMRSMNVPHSMLTLAELRASGCRHSAVVVHEPYLAKLHREGSTAAGGDPAGPTLADLCAHAVDLVVVWDASAPAQTVHSLKAEYGVRVAAGLANKATMLEVFGQVKLVTSRQAPRKLMADAPDGDGNAAESGPHQASQSTHRRQPGPHSGPLSGNGVPALQPRVAKHHLISREHERSHEQAVHRWLVLLHRFSRLAAAQYPNSESFTAMQLRGRVLQIQSLRQEDRQAPLPSRTADDPEHGVYRDLNPAKRRAKYYLGVYEPVLSNLRSLLRARDFAGMERLTATASVRSSNLGLARLNCWFNTLQETLGVIQKLEEDRRSAFTANNNSSSSSSSGGAVMATASGASASSETAASAAVGALGGAGGGLVVEDLMDAGGAEEQGFAGRPLHRVADSLVQLVGEMMDAVEVSVWDAALDK